MGPAIFVIAIMGCGEGDSTCEAVRLLEPRYASEAACTQATEAALARNTDVEYPVVVARCVAAGATPASLNESDVELPPPALPVRTAAAEHRPAG